jgi:hypothetical protein
VIAECGFRIAELIRNKKGGDRDFDHAPFLMSLYFDVALISGGVVVLVVPDVLLEVPVELVPETPEEPGVVVLVDVELVVAPLDVLFVLLEVPLVEPSGAP